MVVRFLPAAVPVSAFVGLSPSLASSFKLLFYTIGIWWKKPDRIRSDRQTDD
jgi:hypothetical protein